MTLARIAFIAGAAIAALVASGSAAADEYGVTLISGFASRHDAAGYNEANHGAGIRFDRGDLAGWSAGYYRNSLSRDSYYVAREWTRRLLPHVHAGVMAGAITGYRFAAVPFAAAELVLRLDPLEIALVYIPRVATITPRVAALQLRWRF